MPTPTSPAVPLGDLEPLSPPPSGLRVLVRKPVLWIALMLAVGIGAVAILQARGPRVTVVAAARTDIAQHVVASGRVRVTTRVRVAAEAAGRVVEVRVREGQTATERNLQAFVSSRAAEYKVPKKILILDEIPKGATGKLQRIGLAAKLGLG